MPVDDEFIERQRRLKADRCARVESVQIHRDRAVHKEAQGVIANPPLLNEGDIREGLGCYCGHAMMLPAL